MVAEKLDGSLIKVWYNAVVRRWVVSTNGTIDADKYGNFDIILNQFLRAELYATPRALCST